MNQSSHRPRKVVAELAGIPTVRAILVTAVIVLIVAAIAEIWLDGLHYVVWAAGIVSIAALVSFVALLRERARMATQPAPEAPPDRP